ncbi:MAG TPA: DUF116 domain-containing protein [Gemmatimonadales bacterium]|nr:DUF116 domain-containing protein [Gemmatimonadales bacterium]
MAEVARAQLIRIETDRRLGHEWDQWDGTPLPNGGDFSAPPRAFFAWLGFALVVAGGVAGGAVFLIAPRLALVWSGLPRLLGWGILGALALVAAWFLLLLLSFYGSRPLLPARALERGPFLQMMNLTSFVARPFGRRDWVEHAAIDIYDTLAERRRMRVGKGELLVLVPRCLSKEALDGVLAVAGRYDVPVFVATRGQLARRAIRERRPRAVVAVACERDMMTGLRDVAGKLPVLGLTMRLPNGPCRDATLDLDVMERWVRSLTEA